MKEVLRTVGQKLLVLPFMEEEQSTDGGVLISNVNNAQLGKAEVILVADNLKHVYSAGEKILYYEKRGVGVIHNNKPHQLIDGGDGLLQGDVLAIID
jgi:co-chaperonin GroES (HSP10)